MDSMWNIECSPYGMEIFHGLHMDSIWNIEWSPYGIEIFHGFHMNSIWNGNILCISHAMGMYSFHVDSIWNTAKIQNFFQVNLMILIF